MNQLTLMTNVLRKARAPALCLAAAALGTALARGADERPVILHLTSGAEVSGTIVDGGFDEANGVKLRRDDNGGELSLRWDQILADDVEAIKRAFGFIGDEPPPMQVRALKVKVRGGKEIVGLDGGKANNARLIVRKGVATPVPEETIEGIENVMIDALEVENAAEAFERVRRDQTPTSAVEWYNLGLSAESLTLYEQAIDCLKTARQMDAKIKEGVIEARIKLCEVKAKESDAADFLRRIRALRLQRDFANAIALADEFGEKWPTSALTPDVMVERRKLGELQVDDLINQVRTDFFPIAKDFCRSKVLDPELELGAAMTWAEDELFGEVLRKLAATKNLKDEAEVMALWEQRGRYTSETAVSYGAGTFILGTDARKGLVPDQKGEEEEEGDESGGAGDSGAAGGAKKEPTLQDKIQEKLKQRAEAAKKQNAKQQSSDDLADIPPTPEDWWKAASSAEKANWLFAFFGEHARYDGKEGVITLSRCSFRECSLCGGHGQRQFYGTSGQSPSGSGGGRSSGGGQGGSMGLITVPCERCKKLTFDRIVHFK